jgi:CcmD family protein
VSLLFAVSPALPLGQAGKYVAAAYIVVFLVILVYVAIMAKRAKTTQREIEELRRDVDAVKAAEAELADDPDHDADQPGSRRSARSEQIA